MKAEHRKELETNLLADRMGRLMQRMKTKPKRRSLLVVVLVVAAAVAVYFWNSSREDRRAQLEGRWYVLALGTDVRQGGGMNMDMLAGYAPTKSKRFEWSVKYAPIEAESDNPSKAARFEVARYWLWDLGVKKLGKCQEPELLSDSGNGFYVIIAPGDKNTKVTNLGPTPVERIGMAFDQYSKLLEECAEEPEWKAEALYGLAVIEETAALHDIKHLKTAKEKYKSLADALPETGHGKLAQQRFKELSVSARYAEVTAFYQEMKTQLNMPPIPKRKFGGL